MLRRIALQVRAFGIQKLFLLLGIYALIISTAIWDALHPLPLYQGAGVSQISPDGKRLAQIHEIKDEWGGGTLRHYFLMEVIDLGTSQPIDQNRLPYSSIAPLEVSSAKTIAWNEASTLVKFGNPAARVWSVTIP